jgi:hypothetical protein
MIRSAPALAAYAVLAVELCEVGHEHQQVAEGHLARGELPDPDADDQEYGPGLEQVDERAERRP